jgi:hypothetical protein
MAALVGLPLVMATAFTSSTESSRLTGKRGFSMIVVHTFIIQDTSCHLTAQFYAVAI